ncbi:MAG: hypothetical protein DHS20C15_28640 [Planctomycetota bacterium]|nr:MAG: hypothetical protein DHS20C15_28640 [Planctomycetota bacterium]
MGLLKLLRVLLLLAIGGLAYLGYERFEGILGDKSAELREVRAELEGTSAELQTVSAELAVRERELDETRVALQYLKVDQRRARIRVLEQWHDPNDAERIITRLRFQELDPGGHPIGPPVEGEIEGRFVYVESLVIKFADDYVERGDAWRGTSLCLFRRVFGDRQPPEDGMVVDPVGLDPEVYRDDASPDLTRELWQNFWDYAHDPDAAAAAGVRAIHGEAPFMEARPGSQYIVELRASGGLSIRSEQP